MFVCVNKNGLPHEDQNKCLYVLIKMAYLMRIKVSVYVC